MHFKLQIWILTIIFHLITTNVYSSNFSDLWKKHGGEIIENKVKDDKDKFSLPVINISKIENVGEKFLVSGVVDNFHNVSQIKFQDKPVILNDKGEFKISGFLPNGGIKTDIELILYNDVLIKKLIVINRVKRFDNQEPTINAFSKQNGSNAIISGRVTDNTEVAEVLVDGQVQELKSNGTFETPIYIPRTGKTVEIIAFDTKGNKASKILKLERGEIKSANIQKFKSLNPSLRRVKPNPNALALIIGISDYENTKASALYADSDAKVFYDYANLKLGIPSSNIKELLNDKADRIDITRAIKSWLLKRTVTDKTDIYVFFAGHGLGTDDGKDVYLLPYDGVPDLLEDSAIKRKELFADIQATKPRSVTVFLDTCYSGGTRNEEETLVASLRPILITAKEQSVPANFTVLSAAKGNQTSQSLEEVKHGLFSYYTMLGMEGGADANNDNKITASELHAFIKDKVERQSQFRQTPELQGDKDRVLVEFN